VELVGRFDEPGDEDHFRFQGKKGTTYWIESVADQMTVTADPFVVIQKVSKAADGKETLVKVVENDDSASFFSVDGLDSINFDTFDSATNFTADADAEYEVSILNQLGDGDAAQIYRLMIREAQPDFDVMASTERPLPSNRTGYSVAPVLRRNARWAIRVVVPRRDGFAGDISVTAMGLPKGVSVTPLILSGKTDHGYLVVSAGKDIHSWAGDIDIVGSANIGGRTVTRKARFAALVWGHVFADSIRVRSRLTQRVPLGVNAAEEAPVIINPSTNQFEVLVGDKLEIPVKLTDNGTRSGNLTIQPYGLYGMLRGYPTVNIAEKTNEGTLVIDFKPNGNFKPEPGTYQFTLMGIGVTKYGQNVAAAERTKKEQMAITKIVEALSKQADESKEAATEAEKNFKETEKNAAAATEKDKTALVKKVTEAKAQVEKTKQAVKELTEKVTRAKKEQDEVKKLADAAEKTAKEKSTKFAAWSDPVTVVVKPKPKK